MGIVFAGQFSLVSGGSFRVYFTYYDPNAGPIFAEPREFQGSTRGNPLLVTGYGTIRNNDNSMTYFLDIKNQGSQTATFELEEGLFSY